MGSSQVSTDLGVDSVGGQQHGGLGRTVDLLLQDLPLHLGSDETNSAINVYLEKYVFAVRSTEELPRLSERLFILFRIYGIFKNQRRASLLQGSPREEREHPGER